MQVMTQVLYLSGLEKMAGLFKQRHLTGFPPKRQEVKLLKRKGGDIFMLTRRCARGAPTLRKMLSFGQE